MGNTKPCLLSEPSTKNPSQIPSRNNSALFVSFLPSHFILIKPKPKKKTNSCNNEIVPFRGTKEPRGINPEIKSLVPINIHISHQTYTHLNIQQKNQINKKIPNPAMPHVRGNDWPGESQANTTAARVDRWCPLCKANFPASVSRDEHFEALHNSRLLALQSRIRDRQRAPENIRR